jgi:hypothetical protein
MMMIPLRTTVLFLLAGFTTALVLAGHMVTVQKKQ